jgi:UDP-N-acetyl-D-glucosamine dehydrogenase
MSFSKIGIDVNRVIEGAATKPFAFMPHYPGIGVGGHCIPVDPYYLIEYARNNGFEHRFLTLARSINESMPVYAVDLLEQALIEKAKKTLSGAKVAVLGLSYKANVGDDRESPAYAVIDSLKQRGADITLYDPYIPQKSTSKDVKAALKGKDAAILVTGHDEFKNILEDIDSLDVLLDGRNFLKDYANQIREKGVHYIGIGVN